MIVTERIPNPSGEGFVCVQYDIAKPEVRRLSKNTYESMKDALAAIEARQVKWGKWS